MNITVLHQDHDDDESILNGAAASTTTDDADFVRHNANSNATASAANNVRDLWQDPTLLAIQRTQAAQVNPLYMFKTPISYTNVTCCIFIHEIDNQILSACSQ